MYACVYVMPYTSTAIANMTDHLFFIYVCICIVTLYIWIKSVTEKITRKIVQGFLNISGSTICWKTSKITRKKNYRKLSCNIFERVSAMFTEQKKNRDGQKIFCF